MAGVMFYILGSLNVLLLFAYKLVGRLEFLKLTQFPVFKWGIYILGSQQNRANLWNKLSKTTKNRYFEIKNIGENFQVILLLNFNECFYVWDGTQCYILQYIFNLACTPAFSLFHLALFIERCYVSLRGKANEERRSRGVFGALMAGIIVVSF